MGIEHILPHHRTGRPKGLRSRPAWVLAVRWAARNLDNPEPGRPPTALARRLLEMGREHPDRLVACLALVSPAQPGPAAEAPVQAQAEDGGFPEEGESRRLRGVSVWEGDI